MLLFGPLYHLTDGARRRQALSEARRVLQPGPADRNGSLRFVSLLDRLHEGWLDDPEFRLIADREVVDSDCYGHHGEHAGASMSVACPLAGHAASQRSP